VVVKGERIGTVLYIGKLDFDVLGQVYIGVHLDMPGQCLSKYLLTIAAKPRHTHIIGSQLSEHPGIKGVWISKIFD